MPLSLSLYIHTGTDIHSKLKKQTANKQIPEPSKFTIWQLRKSYMKSIILQEFSGSKSFCHVGYLFESLREAYSFFFFLFIIFLIMTKAQRFFPRHSELLHGFPNTPQLYPACCCLLTSIVKHDKQPNPFFFFLLSIFLLLVDAKIHSLPALLFFSQTLIILSTSSGKVS